MSSCGHDGWTAGCPQCEAEHDRAVELLEAIEADAQIGSQWLEALKARVAGVKEAE
jgi:hypothetical protein